MSAKVQIARYLIVGAIGFSVDGGILYALMVDGWSPFYARGISFPIAATVTYLLNRVWTFSVQKEIPKTVGEYSAYIVIQIVGALTNFLVYSAILLFIARTEINALLALAVGAVFGLVVNFFGSRYLFNRSKRNHARASQEN